MIAPDTTETKSGFYTVWAVSEYYHPNFSGAAIQAHRILSRLKAPANSNPSVSARPSSVRVLTVADQDAKQLAGKTRQLDGVEIHYLPVVSRRNWDWLPGPLQRLASNFNQMVRDWSFQRAIRKKLNAESASGDIVQWYVIGDFTWFTIRFARLRGLLNSIQISLVGADDPSSFRRSWFGFSTQLKRGCFDQADSIIGLSRALVASCREAGVPMDRVYRIPNGVDGTRFHPNRSQREKLLHELGLENRRYIAFVGSAIHRKGIDVVVPAFIELAKQHNDVDLLIIGPSDFSDRTRHSADRASLVEDLKDQLVAENQSHRVHWLGQIDNVENYLQVSSLFFFPTRREGLPNALAEALACGVPALASSLDGITTDLVTDGVEGRLIEGHRADDYARALIELFGAPAELDRMSLAASTRIERDFALPTIAEKYASHYNELRDVGRS